MGGYIPPRFAKRQKRQARLDQEAAAAAAKAGMNPTSHVFIPGLTLIQQSNNSVVPQQPSQPIPPPRPISTLKKTRKQSPTAAPKAKSGGVPDPTPQYIAQALLNPHVLPEPRRILIIMDLNGTLLYRPNKKRPFNFVERPHARSFLSYCLETFYVAIWSSARPENVSKMVDQLIDQSQRDRCLLIWARDKFGLTLDDYNSKVQVYKRLTSVWADPRVMSSHPTASSGGRWDQTNTVLVDDSLEKARSEPFNLLQLPEFSGLANEQVDVLPQVHDYLNTLSHQGDISRYMRTQPFKLDPSYQLP
ncbi:HAD-like domain-containing protein [Thelonectria olida]|uniref:Mitochondrial import inner membrane translocase subunit TIM50 n=1 Tax=Thelonectria olida TaxID=1576542 RepID=A0A9P8W616_9HYPO|nr:HAD-like domain-containing protein [Thelonectria olida]